MHSLKCKLRNTDWGVGSARSLVQGLQVSQLHDEVNSMLRFLSHDILQCLLCASGTFLTTKSQEQMHAVHKSSGRQSGWCAQLLYIAILSAHSYVQTPHTRRSAVQGLVQTKCHTLCFIRGIYSSSQQHPFRVRNHMGTDTPNTAWDGQGHLCEAGYFLQCGKCCLVAHLVAAERVNIC